MVIRLQQALHTTLYPSNIHPSTGQSSQRSATTIIVIARHSQVDGGE